MKKILVLFLLSFVSEAQFLQDSESQQIVVKGLDKLYNLQFREAEEIFNPVLQKYKDHPVSFLLKATVLQWKYMPIENQGVKFQEYLENLEKCKKTANKLYSSGANKPEATFYLLSAYGYVSRSYHYRKDYLKAGLEARKAYSFLKEGFELSKKNRDFLFTNGLYRFYRIQYPETHPQIKPIIYFFANGNKQQGLTDLRDATKQALFTKIEATYFLAGICLKYEDRNAEALNLIRKLHSKYPLNPEFLLKNVEALLRNGLYDQAEVKNQELGRVKGLDYEMAYLVFGSQIDMKLGRNRSAELKLVKVETLKGDGKYTKDLKSMAYLNLGRISLIKNDMRKAREYFNDCLDIAEYTSVIKEAEKELSKI